MVTIRPYDENSDAHAVGILIAETYRGYNLGFAVPEEQEKLLGPFRHAHSTDPAHHAEIVRVLRTEMVLVAEESGEIVGVVRFKKERLQSLFVSGNNHRRGIGRMLVEGCERELARRGSHVVRLAATQYAVPFYEAVGYKKSTGLRSGWSFEGYGLKYQPMKKYINEDPVRSKP